MYKVRCICKGLTFLSCMNFGIIKTPKGICLDCSCFYLDHTFPWLSLILYVRESKICLIWELFFSMWKKSSSKCYKTDRLNTRGIRQSLYFSFSSFISWAWSFASWVKKVVGGPSVTFISRKQEEVSKKGKRHLLALCLPLMNFPRSPFK